MSAGLGEEQRRALRDATRVATSLSSSGPWSPPGGRPIEIGFVNNLPDKAVPAAERQFGQLIAAVAGDQPVRLRLFTLPEVPRQADARAEMAGRYADPSGLAACRLDALIVSGAEPQADCLTQEPYWDSLRRVFDWAEASGTPTLLSCLAAHAAVLHRHGIRRGRMSAKLSGVYRLTRCADHPLLDGCAEPLAVPHSRWNDLPEAAVRAAGYRILTRSDATGLDMFVDGERGTFLHMQGHPEYEPDTLLREYKRDLRRFVDGVYPAPARMPEGYFDTDTTARLTAFEGALAVSPTARTLARFPELPGNFGPRSDWRDSAKIILRNWFHYVRQQRP